MAVKKRDRGDGHKILEGEGSSGAQSEHIPLCDDLGRLGEEPESGPVHQT